MKWKSSFLFLTLYYLRILFCDKKDGNNDALLILHQAFIPYICKSNNIVVMWAIQTNCTYPFYKILCLLPIELYGHQLVRSLLWHQLLLQFSLDSNWRLRHGSLHWIEVAFGKEHPPSESVVCAQLLLEKALFVITYCFFYKEPGWPFFFRGHELKG